MVGPAGPSMVMVAETLRVCIICPSMHAFGRASSARKAAKRGLAPVNGGSQPGTTEGGNNDTETLPIMRNDHNKCRSAMIRRSAIAGDRVAVLQRAALQDTRISFRALGVLCAVLSRPEDWRTSAVRLAGERPAGEGRDAVGKALQELEAAGYLVRRRIRGERGRFLTTWELSDVPREEPGEESCGGFLPVVSQGREPGDGGSSPKTSHHVSPGGTGDGFSGIGEPGVGAPEVGKPGLLLGVDTGSRDKTPPPPSAEVSPVPAPWEGQGGERDDRVEEFLAAVSRGTGLSEVDLGASVPLRAALRALVRAGVTLEVFRGACEARPWQGAGVGAVVRWVQERVRTRDLVVVERGPAAPECVEHPGEPAGRCRLCERAAVPVARVAGFAAAARAAMSARP